MYFARKTFRRRVLQKIVGVSHTTHIPHISITPHISHTYPFQTYPINTYPTNTYPFNTYPTNTYPCDAYPFNAYPCKRFASAGMAMYVNAKHILACHCISRNGNVCECKTYPCISLISRNGNEYEYHCMSFHSYHCYSAGMVMKIETLLFFNFFASLLIEYNCIARV